MRIIHSQCFSRSCSSPKDKKFKDDLFDEKKEAENEAAEGAKARKQATGIGPDY